ncbi:MAG: hypothetical protein IT435_02495 [Phycisphaerales bacterium]|nr:hypothetical protein [Phycisphaerales bacterium]
MPSDATTGTEAAPPTSTENSPGGADAAESITPDSILAPKPKLRFTSKIRRGLALVRMIDMAAQREDMAPVPALLARWPKRAVDEYNAALAWIEQEEDWEAVEKVWSLMGGDR